MNIFQQNKDMFFVTLDQLAQSLDRCIGGGTDSDIKGTKGGVGIAGGAVIKEKSASGAVPRF